MEEETNMKTRILALVCALALLLLSLISLRHAPRPSKLF